MRRTLALLTLAAALAFAAPAQAKYLHKVDAEAAVARFLPAEARGFGASSGTLLRCWRGNAHVLGCKVVFTDVPSGGDEFLLRETVLVSLRRDGRVYVVGPFEPISAHR